MPGNDYTIKLFQRVRNKYVPQSSVRTWPTASPCARTPVRPISPGCELVDQAGCWRRAPSGPGHRRSGRGGFTGSLIIAGFESLERDRLGGLRPLRGCRRFHRVIVKPWLVLPEFKLGGNRVTLSALFSGRRPGVNKTRFKDTIVRLALPFCYSPGCLQPRAHAQDVRYISDRRYVPLCVGTK